MLTLIKSRIPLQSKKFINFLNPLIYEILYPRFTAYNVQGIRSLYDKQSLGINGFLTQGVKLRNDILYHKEIFVQKMQALAQNSGKNQIIYTEDLRRLIALCQEEKEHLDLIVSLIKKYYEQSLHSSLCQFRFGPEVLRLLYIHELTEKAVEILLDEDFASNMTENATYQIAMDLLYEKECYEDVLKLMKTMKSLPKSCVILALAANYKIATDESLEDSLNLHRKVYDSGQRPTLRMLTFTAALALKKGKPDIALEMCGHSKNQKNYLISNLRILAKARLGELNEVMVFLRNSALVDDLKMGNRHVCAPDVIDEIEKILNDKLLLEEISNFSSLKKRLKSRNLISSPSLDESICSSLKDQVESKTRIKRQLYTQTKFPRRHSYREDEQEHDEKGY